jgi:glyoxylase-like metal-dependent hydrolase (beta-lactamase superfamily II)
MKIYSYVNLLPAKNFSNCYLVTNDDTMQAIIVDPCRVTTELVSQIETGPYQLAGVLITHNHGDHVSGIPTLRKIYDTVIFAADYEVAQHHTTILRDDGAMTLAGLTVTYTSVPGHTPDSMVYKIGHVLFTGDAISAGRLGSTTSTYSKRTLVANLERKVLSLPGTTILCPGHGPPTSVAAEKLFNRELLDTMRGMVP